MLVNCAAYAKGHKIADIPKEAISDYLEQPGTFVWVALKDPSDAELAQMQEEFALHPLAVEDASHGHPRHLRPPAARSQQLDGLRDMVITAMSVNLSTIQLAESEVTKRLAAYAALVAVPTLIAGIYGMNFERMPELKWMAVGR